MTQVHPGINIGLQYIRNIIEIYSEVTYTSTWGESPSSEARTSKYGDEGSSIQPSHRGRFIGGIGRGIHKEVKCYACGEIGHMSWNCPRNQSSNQRNVNVVEAQEESKEEINMNNPWEEGESLMLKIFLVKSEKQVHEPSQRKSSFQNKV